MKKTIRQKARWWCERGTTLFTHNDPAILRELARQYAMEAYEAGYRAALRAAKKGKVKK